MTYCGRCHLLTKPNERTPENPLFTCRRCGVQFTRPECYGRYMEVGKLWEESPDLCSGSCPYRRDCWTLTQEIRQALEQG